MKKLIVLLLLVPFVIYSCGNDSEDYDDTQNYTSFTIYLDVDTDNLKDLISGYYNKNGECILLKKHGDLTPFKETAEFILPEYQREIYLFYNGTYGYSGMRLEKSFKLNQNKKNNIIIQRGEKGITIQEKNEHTWPH